MINCKATRARRLFESNLDLIHEVVGWIRHRHALPPESAEDFASYVQLKLLEDDCVILRKFRGSSTLKTYLTTVVRHLFLDYRVHRWGKWRPSAAARRKGPTAVRLEMLINRDGRTLEDAIEILKRNEGVHLARAELRELAERLPRRAPRRFEDLEGVFDLPSTDRAETAIDEGEHRAVARTAESVLAEALSAMPAEDRELLKMRFADGSTVALIAETLGVAQRPLYRRIERCLRQLRHALEQRGLTRETLLDFNAWHRLDIELDLGLS